VAQKLILIGASTGGPGHLKKILKNVKLNGAIIVIAQHMNKMFINSFAMQIGKECGLDVEILNERKILKENTVYVCEPNVDVLFKSGVGICKSANVLAILLTGIGDDGASGLDKLYKAGAKCIAENEESAIVYGMPKRAKELNQSLKSLNLTMIKKELEDFLNAIN